MEVSKVLQNMLQEADCVWLELQEELAALSTNRSWTVVENADHFIHYDQPEIVIETIRGILAQATADHRQSIKTESKLGL